MVRIVAEIGINHGGSADVARAMIDAAADAGADSVKFQLFDPARLISRAASPAGIHDFFNQFVLPRDAVKELKAHADARGMDFFAAPFDPDSLEFLVALGAQRINGFGASAQGLIQPTAQFRPEAQRQGRAGLADQIADPGEAQIAQASRDRGR